MATEGSSKAVQVDGEVLLIHCWACGAAHWVNVKLLNSEELGHMVCGESNCGMSMFLVNELTVDDLAVRRARANDKSAVSAAFSRLWK